MPGKPQALTDEAERLFPVRIAVKVGGDGIGRQYAPMRDWLGENCGLNGWSITSTGRRMPMGQDAIAVYVGSPTCATAFVARWCVPGDPPGFYDLRRDEPERRIPIATHG
jgi:hypothetical protein